MIDIPIDTLRYLNPVYKMDIIPEMEHQATLVLPKDKVIVFLKNGFAIPFGTSV